MAKKLLEICCYNVESVEVAAKAGAHRVEFCSPVFTGGGTPKENDLTEAKKKGIRTFVMLHPREGNYAYDDAAFEKLKQQVKRFKELGAEGLVMGVLDENGNIDIDRNKELIALASPLEITLHKAFDEVKDPFKALEDAISCGFTRILTSGTKKTALEGKSILAELVARANGRIIIMAGGSIRSTNIRELAGTGV